MSRPIVKKKYRDGSLWIDHKFKKAVSLRGSKHETKKIGTGDRLSKKFSVLQHSLGIGQAA